MFWRVVRRLLLANRARLAVILLALGSGAAVCAALLNLQVDAKRRLASEFRAFGANVTVTERSGASGISPATMDERVYAEMPAQFSGENVPRAAFLYIVAKARTGDDANALPEAASIVAGYESSAGDLHSVRPGQVTSEAPAANAADGACQAGQQFARKMNVAPGQIIHLSTAAAAADCTVTRVISFGGAEDSQLFVPLGLAQRLAGLPGRITLAEAAVPGTPAAVQEYIHTLAARLPEQDVHGIRQFTEAEASIYGRIASVLDGTVLIVLLLTGLCVMAAMTSVAMERKNDVGLMKAIGGATRSVVRLFFAEAAALGLVGGVVGTAAGMLLSIALGQAVFGVPARPRPVVYPVVVALTMLVALAGAYPLRRVASVRPASVFRGEP